MTFNQCGIDGQLPQAQPFAQHAQHAAARPQAHAAFRQLDHAVLAFHERRALGPTSVTRAQSPVESSGRPSDSAKRFSRMPSPPAGENYVVWGEEIRGNVEAPPQTPAGT